MNLAAYLSNAPFPLPVGNVRTIYMDQRPIDTPACRNSATNTDIRKANRIKVLASLDAGPGTAPEIAADIGLTTQSVRKITNELIDDGLVTFERKDGVKVFSRIANQPGNSAKVEQ